MSEIRVEHDANRVYRTPPWVKGFVIFILVLVLLLGIMVVTGEHGPGRHSPSDGSEHPSSIEHRPHHP